MAPRIDIDRYNAVMDLYEKGMSQADIARRFGVAVWVVQKVVARARRIGDARANSGQNANYYEVARRKHGSVGSIRAVMAALSPGAAQWLINETPHGATVSDVLAAVVNDAYMEDAGE